MPTGNKVRWLPYSIYGIENDAVHIKRRSEKTCRYGVLLFASRAVSRSRDPSLYPPGSPETVDSRHITANTGQGDTGAGWMAVGTGRGSA